MIKNYNDTLHFIETTQKQINKIQKLLNSSHTDLNAEEAQQLRSREKFLKLQILNYISYYREKAKMIQKDQLIMEKLTSLQKKYSTELSSKE